MKTLASIMFSVLLVVGCASTAAKQYVGQSIEEAYFELGPPENVIDLVDGRRAFQFYWGGGEYMTPARATSTIRPGYNGSATVDTVMTPAQVYSSKGCLITLIADGSDEAGWIVREWRIPDRLVC